MQVCVTSPALAPWAQIPLALAAGIETAPAGAAELVKTAITLGADADALKPILAGMPPLEGIQVPDQAELLSPRPEAVKAEEALAAELTELGVKMGDWTPPPAMRAPKGKPSEAVDGALRAVAMRSLVKARRAGTHRGEKALPYVAPANDVLPVVATPARAATPALAQAAPAPMEMETEAKPRGMKRMFGKTTMAVDAGDIE